MGEVIWHGRWVPRGRHLIEMFHNYFGSTCYVVCPQYRYFQHSSMSAIVTQMTCTFLDCLSTHLQLERVISVFILIFLHILCLCMFLIDSGWSNMVWQLRSFCPSGEISLIESKLIFKVCILLYPPKNIFQHHSCCRNYEPYHIHIFLSFLL